MRHARRPGHPPPSRWQLSDGDRHREVRQEKSARSRCRRLQPQQFPGPGRDGSTRPSATAPRGVTPAGSVAWSRRARRLRLAKRRRTRAARRFATLRPHGLSRHHRCDGGDRHIPPERGQPTLPRIESKSCCSHLHSTRTVGRAGREGAQRKAPDVSIGIAIAIAIGIETSDRWRHRR